MLRMRPQPFAFIAGTSRRERKNGAESITSICSSQAASVISSTGWRWFRPAACTTMSMSPWGFAQSLARASSVSRRPTSPGSTEALAPPSATMASRASSSGPARRPQRTTDAPALASASASARPMPVPAPVTRATLPSRRKRSRTPSIVKPLPGRRAQTSPPGSTCAGDRRRCARAPPSPRGVRCARRPARSGGSPPASCAAR